MSAHVMTLPSQDGSISRRFRAGGLCAPGDLASSAEKQEAGARQTSPFSLLNTILHPLRFPIARSALASSRDEVYDILHQHLLGDDTESRPQELFEVQCSRLAFDNTSARLEHRVRLMFKQRTISSRHQDACSVNATGWLCRDGHYS